MSRKPFFRAFDGWWYAQVRVGAKRKQVKLVKGKEHEQEAYRAFCRLLADHEGEAPRAEAMTVAAVCDLFLDHVEKHNKADTFKVYRYYLQDVCLTHGRRMATELKPFHISRWLDTHPTWKGSRCNAIEAIKRAFSWATAEGLLDRNPIQQIKKPAKGRRVRVLSPDERTQILAAIRDTAFREFVFAMQETGCRPSEVAKVSAEQVDLTLGVWKLFEHKTAKKTHRPRIVYLTPAMLELSRRLIGKHSEGPLFRSPQGKSFSKNNVRCRFRRLREKLPQLKHFVSYHFRHTYATQALLNGVGIAHVAELLGHTSTEMVMRHYGHLSEQVDHMRAVAAKASNSVECA